MGYYTTAEIVKIVNRLIDRCGTRNPYRVAKELGINIIYRNFDKQRGAYKVKFFVLLSYLNVLIFVQHLLLTLLRTVIVKRVYVLVREQI